MYSRVFEIVAECMNYRWDRGTFTKNGITYKVKHRYVTILIPEGDKHKAKLKFWRITTGLLFKRIRQRAVTLPLTRLENPKGYEEL